MKGRKKDRKEERKKERFLSVMFYDRVVNSDKEPKMGKKKQIEEAKRNERGGQLKNEHGNNEKKMKEK